VKTVVALEGRIAVEREDVRGRERGRVTLDEVSSGAQGH
jgi:hypothetical protein